MKMNMMNEIIAALRSEQQPLTTAYLRYTAIEDAISCLTESEKIGEVSPPVNFVAAAPKLTHEQKLLQIAADIDAEKRKPRFALTPSPGPNDKPKRKKNLRGTVNSHSTIVVPNGNGGYRYQETLRDFIIRALEDGPKLDTEIEDHVIGQKFYTRSKSFITVIWNCLWVNKKFFIRLPNNKWTLTQKGTLRLEVMKKAK